MSKRRKKSKKPTRHPISLSGTLDATSTNQPASDQPERERGAEHVAAAPSNDKALKEESNNETLLFGTGIVAIVLAILFSYWPTLIWMEGVWRSEDDYSHGYIVLPLAAILLWMRWDSRPRVTGDLDWYGFVPIGFAILMRTMSSLAYMDFLDGWSIVPMLAGIIWVFFGWRTLYWAMPAILFLLMAVRLPFQAEGLLSWELQGVATKISTCLLVILGQPAVSEGHTIWLGDQQLFVERACSGMRIFVGMFALAFFWCATTQRSWLDRLVIILSAIPLALLVNAMRIVVIGLLIGMFETDEAKQRLHDWSGLMMIPLAGFLLWLVKVFWQRLYREYEVVNPAGEIRDRALRT